MSLVLNSSGGGSVTLNEPVTASTIALALPAASGTVALTSDIPAGSTTLLGTLTTTSGTSQTLSGLDLTAYKALKLFYSNVGSGTSILQVNSSEVSTAPTSTQSHWGLIEIDLSSGVFSSTLKKAIAGTGSVTATLDSSASGKSAVANSTTSIVVAASGGSFTRGAVTVYGVK